MQAYLPMFLLLAIISSVLYGQGPPAENVTNYKTQRKIVAELSGATALDDGLFIPNRSSSENRALTRRYLQGIIRDIGLQPKVQPYAMPNVNPLIDVLFNPFRGANVYVTLPATNDSEEYVVLGAHYDTERGCPGAIDNASGVSLAFGVIHQLSKLKHRHKNVLVVFFDQEEEDLIGSQAFVKYLQAQNLNVHSVHTFDTIGWDNDGDRSVELELPTPYLENAYREEARLLNIPIQISPCNSTDHHSFRTQGFNAVGLTDEYYNGDYPPFKDTPEDTFEKVNFEYLKSCTQLVKNTIAKIIKPVQITTHGNQ